MKNLDITTLTLVLKKFRVKLFYFLCRHTCNHSIVRNIPVNNRTGSYNTIIPNGNSWQNCGTGSDPCIITNYYGLTHLIINFDKFLKVHLDCWMLIMYIDKQSLNFTNFLYFLIKKKNHL